MGALQRPGPFVTELNIHIWEKSLKTEGESREQERCRLQGCFMPMEWEKSEKMYFSSKIANVLFLYLPNSARNSHVVHSNRKHTRKSILWNGDQPVQVNTLCQSTLVYEECLPQNRGLNYKMITVIETVVISLNSVDYVGSSSGLRLVVQK